MTAAVVVSLKAMVRDAVSGSSVKEGMQKLLSVSSILSCSRDPTMGLSGIARAVPDRYGLGSDQGGGACRT